MSARFVSRGSVLSVEGSREVTAIFCVQPGAKVGRWNNRPAVWLREMPWLEALRLRHVSQDRFLQRPCFPRPLEGMSLPETAIRREGEVAGKHYLSLDAKWATIVEERVGLLLSLAGRTRQ